MYPASPAMPNWEGHHARAEIYPKPDDLQSTAAMSGDLMFNYRDARMTYTPIPDINTKCQWQDQTPGSPRAHRPSIREVEWSIEVQGGAGGSLGQGPLLLGGITTPPSTTPPPPSLTCRPLPAPLTIGASCGTRGSSAQGPLILKGEPPPFPLVPPSQTCYPLLTP